jgi:hypothetical protein
MADLILAQIPTTATATAEALGVYSCSLLYDLFGNTNYREVQGADLTPLVSAQQGRAADGTERLIYRVAFQLHPEWRTSVNKIWQDTLEFAEAEIPNRYKA